MLHENAFSTPQQIHPSIVVNSGTSNIVHPFKCPIPRQVILRDVNLSRHPLAPQTPESLFTPLSVEEAVEIEDHGKKLLILNLRLEITRVDGDNNFLINPLKYNIA